MSSSFDNLLKREDVVMRSHLAGGVVGVLGQLGVHAVQADRVGDVADGEARLVQDGDDAFVRLLHKINDDLVVEVVDLNRKRSMVKCKIAHLVSCPGHPTVQNSLFTNQKIVIVTCI